MSASGTAQLVDRQLRRWELERRAAREALGEGTPERGHTVSVTISRRRGCRGPAIAAALAERLGYTLFGRELVDFIATDHKVCQRVLDMLDEKVASAIHLWAEGIVAGRHVDQRDFVRFLSETVRAIHEHGGAVVLGRGANCILEGQTAFRVHLTARLDARVQQVMREDNIDEERAREEVKEWDGRREAFVRNSFGADWRDPALYDLVVNVEFMEDEDVVDLIEDYLRRYAVKRWPEAAIGRV
jgi:cytidylate kinase